MAQAQVPEQILQWLWNALQSNYRNPQATYSDAVAVLSAYPSLQPRTEVYTYNNGQPALLLCLSGTLPVNFRGTVYRFPIKIWVPQSHPQDPEGVMVFVIPGEAMMIRPGQHVGVDGRVYHPYLRDWSSRQQSTMTDFVRILQDVFAREPPVVARQQQQQYRQQGQPQSPNQRPPPPPKERPGSVLQQHQQPAEMPAGPNPPPKPPKLGDQGRAGTPVQNQQKGVNRDGPPLPPLPHERPQHGYQSPQLLQRGNGFDAHPTYASGSNGRPPVPPLPYGSSQTYPRDSPVSPVSSNGYAQAGPSKRYSHAAPLPQSPIPSHGSQNPQAPYPGQQGPAQQSRPPQSMPHHQGQQHQQRQEVPPQQYQPQPQQPYPRQQQSYQQQPQHQQNPYQQQQQQYHQAPPLAQATPKPAPPIDLLTDPFDVSLPTTIHHNAPPIPPNPEREHLLHHLSQSLVFQTHQKISQTNSAIPALQAQNQALQEASHNLQLEIAQLEQLDRVLASNEAILRSAMDECDAVIQKSKNMPEPAIDDVLVAPTLVANQLWNLEAEIAGLKEGIWVLQRAVGQGRVGGVEFTRLNRGLARELFLKMMLARKIARGMGLDVGVVGNGLGNGGSGDEGFYS